MGICPLCLRICIGWVWGTGGNSCVSAWCLYGCPKATQILCLYWGGWNVVTNAAACYIWCSVLKRRTDWRFKSTLTVYLLALYMFFEEKKIACHLHWILNRCRSKNISFCFWKTGRSFYISFNFYHFKNSLKLSKEKVSSIPTSSDLQ